MDLARGPVFGLMMVGGCVFSLVGYLLRPSAMIVGQLPFHAVISRGATLSGLEEFLVPVARTSFTYLVVGAVLFVLLGLAVALWLQPIKRDKPIDSSF